MHSGEYSMQACRIVTLNRLVYRKGIDLQAVIIPILCRSLPVRFLVGGDGPMRSTLEAMVEQHALHAQVQLVGSVPHEAARDLLVQGALTPSATARIQSL